MHEEQKQVDARFRIVYDFCFVFMNWKKRDHEEERERDNKTENYITSPGEFVASENGSSQINGLI